MHTTTPNSAKHVRYLHRQGVTALTAPGRAAHHIHQLRAAGLRDPHIATAAGISCATLYRIARQHTPRITRATEQRILAVTIPDQPITLTGRAATTASHGTARRLQALVVAGNPPAVLATLLDIGRGHLGDLLHQRNPHVAIHTAARITRLYLQRWQQPAEHHGVPAADAAAARALAGRYRWAPSVAWDDIDAPDAAPDLGVEATRQAAVIEDTAELAAQGYSREGIAWRLGIGWDAVRQAHRRGGMPLPVLLDD